MPKVEIYINKRYEHAFDTIKALASIEDTHFNTKIGEALEYYLSQGTPYIIAEKKKWKALLHGKTKKELIELNTLISELNNTILKEIYVN